MGSVQWVSLSVCSKALFRWSILARSALLFFPFIVEHDFRNHKGQQKWLSTAATGCLCFHFPPNMNSLTAFPGHWQLFLAFAEEKESHSTVLQIEARKGGSLQKQSCLSCGSFGAREAAAGNTFTSRTHLRSAVLDQGQPISTWLIQRNTPPHLPGMSNFRSENDLVWLSLRTVFLHFWLRRLNSVSRTEQSVCLGQKWDYSH